MSGPEVRARSLDRQSPLPLWAQLSEDLARRLEAGAFRDGFPSEHALVAEYVVSRHTVRDALRRLRQDGLLESARGRGTWVRKAQIEQPLGALYSLFREVENRGMEQRSEVLQLEARTAPNVAARLQIPEETEFVYIERLRYADAEPLALDHTWLLRSLASGLLDADLTHTGLYDELATGAGVVLTGGQERIHAVTLTAGQRRALAVGSGVAGLAIERIGCVRDRPVEWRETVVRGDRFSVVAEWSPRKGYQMDVAGGSPLVLAG